MIEIALSVLFLYAFVLCCWTLYIAIMGLKARRDELGWVARAHGYLLLAFAYPLDAALNVLLSLLLFWDMPRGWLFTSTLKYHLYRGTSDRKRALAMWICFNLLDPFDPSGRHC